MARNAALVAVLAVCLGAPASAQALQRLHVRSMVAGVDPQRVRLGDMVRLRVRIHVDEHVARLDNVILPDLSGFDVLGDERRCVAVRRGTDCTETLSLAPSAAGVHTIGPVSLDAVDARNGRPTRFGSNAVSVTVTAATLSGPARTLGGIASALRPWAIAGLIVSACLALVLGFRRRKPIRAQPIVPPVVVAERPARDEDARWRTVIAARGSFANASARPPDPRFGHCTEKLLPPFFNTFGGKSQL